jgi:hypothetical protein
MIKINEDISHFAAGYRRAVVTDFEGDELTVNVLPNSRTAFVSIGDETCVAINDEDFEKLAAFFAQFI